jgi:membrane fusion protein (multidrug efflux system)
VADRKLENHELEDKVVEAREPWPEEAEAEEPSRRRARSYFRQHPAAKWVLLFILAAAATAGTYIWRYYSVRESTDDAQIDGHIVPVSARVGGTVQRVNVDDNQLVPAGMVLVQLDPKDYQVALAKARAEYADTIAAEAAARTGVPITSTTTISGLATARANLNAANQEVDAARARLQEADANYTKVAADLNRMKQLIAKDEISRQQYDAAVAAEQAARATVDAVRAAVAAAQSHVMQAEAQVESAATGPQQVQVTQARADAAEAAVQRAKANLDQAELNLQYATVRAPFAGVVSKRSVEPGQVVAAGQPLFAIVNLEDIWVTANFKETELHSMCPGQPATVHVDTFNRDYNGHVDSLGGATGARFSLLPPENATGNYVKVVQRIPVKIVFEIGQDPNHLLRPGMSVEPTVRVDQPCKATATPQAAPR